MNITSILCNVSQKGRLNYEAYRGLDKQKLKMY